ncbi:hypothetical protein RHMOL_Rhmol05G0146300 [Rhododendron molle]|uniref:Uncharacterized protein n=2 Tax=Rhododendron molle TaxID=49168 RepID=A0ACC0NQ48_RHOML|nr:hypothetical protein RHMOL_Rhmol05G0146300 [Rhododendron molle]KAI8555075.1 hypothetical protein RHMOL_Rhmol05G0146300 [Rhododendron molle]
MEEAIQMASEPKPLSSLFHLSPTTSSDLVFCPTPIHEPSSPSLSTLFLVQCFAAAAVPCSHRPIFPPFLFSCFPLHLFPSTSDRQIFPSISDHVVSGLHLRLLSPRFVHWYTSPGSGYA